MSYHGVLKADGEAMEVQDDHLLRVLEEPTDVLD